MVSCSGFFPTTSGQPAPLPPLNKLRVQADADGREAPPERSGRGHAEQRDSVHCLWRDQVNPGCHTDEVPAIAQHPVKGIGQLAQAELGLDYYISRWYDPVLGHFTQADTLIPEPGKASAFDRYAYVQNNPLKFSDPSGHDVGCAGTDASNCVKKNSPLIRNLGYRTYAIKAESEEEFDNLRNSAANHDITDAEFMYRMFTSTTQPGVNLKDRSSYIFDITKSGPYLQFKYSFGDTGFSIEYRDGGNQVNHFLEAVRLGSSAWNKSPSGSYFIDSLIIGHELSGDNLFGNGELNERYSNLYQLLQGLDPVKHLEYAMNDTGFDTLLINDRNDIYRVDKINRYGNSVMDIQLSRKGVELGRAILFGSLDTNNEAATWLLNNICANSISCQ